MPRYHRRYDPKEHRASLEMLRKVEEIRRKASAPIPLIVANTEEASAEEERSDFVKRHNEWRGRMITDLGWPESQLPTADTAWEARELLRVTEPFVCAGEKTH